MHRIDGPGATADNKFTEGDPVGGVQATVVTEDWLNDVQEELISILTAAGITPAKGTQNQILAALRGSSLFQTPALFDFSKRVATTEFVKNAGFQFSQTTQYISGPRTLTASQAGSFIDLAGAYTGDVTLPALSSVPDGATFYIWSGASASLNVNRSGSDQIFVNGAVVNSIAMSNGDTLVIGKSSPAGAWVAMWGSAQFPYSAVYAGLAPKPIAVPGRGAWQANVAGVNSALVAPAGGTWSVFALPFASGGLSQTGVAPIATVVAGGTTITAAVSGQYWYGFFWRLQ
ncbi:MULTISPECIES: hypothetical protein [Pseudomonas]|uniref:hypothetical protein n=1 Tax=Pseudomonas TaxID=286 RepID=UPI0010711A0F|nr:MULTISPECIES: hypothetical protein [Pseudomonas]QBR31897.1 hypothetical protein E3Z29_15815 [Pseudomonas sp. S150]UZT95429.1 hypothetical protein OPS05_12935 [Pseudomonas koreensis]